MSIIQEAIRKAQKTNSGDTARNVPAEKEDMFQYVQDRPKARNISPVLYALVLLILLSVFAVQHFSLIPKKSIARSTTVLAQDPKPESS